MWSLRCAALALLLGLSHRAAAVKAVFAHFMVDNAAGFAISDWESEMSSAATASIDAFVLNIAAGSANNADQIANAFAAANALGYMRLFFSFDYAGNGAWAKADVIALITTYASNAAYFMHEDAAPLVSTFEGPANAADWVEIKAQTGCFFVPDWSSLGPGPAIALENGVADGLFSWAAWPWDDQPMDTYTDAAYMLDVGDKVFMMAASPCFYTNLPGYSKNWMWPDYTMGLWATRWTEVLFLQPDYVEIISWNDFGESHYIGLNHASPPFTDGYATYDYVTGIDHDAWRWPLQVWADQYKSGVASFTSESVTLEYLLHHVADCSDGGTTVNTATQLQQEFFPASELSSAYISFTAVLASAADVTLVVGSTRMIGTWDTIPTGGVGVYHGKVQSDLTGVVSIELARDGITFLTFTGEAIGGCTTEGYANFNPWVGGAFAEGSVAATTLHDVADLVCIQGSGAGAFEPICATTCKFGYCPPGACVCTAIGIQVELPDATGTVGYAKSDENFSGLCSWAYNYGFTFEDVCSTTKQPLTIPIVSPFLPDACTGGTSRSASVDAYGDGITDLCQWACGYGWCPIRICVCQTTGPLVPLEDVTLMSSDVIVYTLPPPDTDTVDITLTQLCNFACQYGNCVCEVDDSIDAVPPCDFSLGFSDLAALQAVSDQYSTYCNEIYILDVLSNDMAEVLANFTDVDNGYDDVFGYYIEYMNALISPAIASFMNDDGYTYFDCSPLDSCPDPSDVVPYGDTEFTWTLRDSEGFYAALLEGYGIEADWVTFEAVKMAHYCPPTSPPDLSCPATTYQTWNDYPVQADDITIANPKDFFTQAGPALQTLPATIDATFADLLLGQWNGSAEDAVDAYALPVAMAQQAIQGMQDAKAIGKKQEEEDKEALIVLILTVVLAVVPFVGEEVAVASGLTAVARAITLAGVAANSAFDLYSVVKDSSTENTVMAVFGLLFGGAGVAALRREGDAYATIAGQRRGIGATDIAKLGSLVDEKATSIKAIMKSCTL